MMDYGPPSTSSSRSLTADLQSEIDEMNNILEVERKLVLQTQENYKQMKKKYLECEKENKSIKKELTQLKLYVNENERMHDVIADLEKKSREFVQHLSEDSHEREVQYIQFRTETLTEVQRAFRKEITDQKTEIERIAKEKEELIEENDKLLEAIRELNSQLLRARRELKKREHEMSLELSTQIDEFILQLNESRESDLDKLSDKEVIEQQRSRIQKLEGSIKEEEETKFKMCEELQERIRLLEEENLQERKKAIKADAQAQRSMNEAITLRLVIEQKQADLDALRGKLNAALKDQLTLELQISERERRLELDHHDQSMVFREKLNELEYYINEKDITIDDLQRRLLDNRIDESDNTKELETDKDSKQRLKDIQAKYEIEIEKIQFEHNQKILELKLERNNLESVITELKRRLEVTPETISDTTKLRKNIIEKDEEISKLKEHYRDLLRRMKQSLLSLEKKYKRAQQKLDESILI